MDQHQAYVKNETEEGQTETIKGQNKETTSQAAGDEEDTKGDLGDPPAH